MERIFYRLGQILFVFILLFLIISVLFGTEWLNQFPECFVHAKTGLYCPGCGGTRAVLALLEFKLAESFRFHPFVPYIGIVYLVFMVECFCKKRIKKQKIKIIRMDICMYIGIAIIILQFLVKNVYLIAYGSSWL